MKPSGGGAVRGVAWLSIILGLVVVLTDGNLLAGLALPVAAAIILLTLYRLDWGLYVFLGFVLLFDQDRVPGFEPVTHQIQYFKNIKEVSYLPAFPAGVVNLLELHLLFLVFVWLLTIAVRKERPVNRVPVWFGAGLLFFWLGVSFVYGLQSGGDFLPALWEIRALFYLGVMYFFVPQVIQTREQIHGLFWVCIAAITWKAVQGVARFISLGFNFGGYQTLTNHEDPVFFITLMIFLTGLVVFDAKTKQRTALLWLLVPLVAGFVVALRRATYGSCAASIVGLMLLLPKKERLMIVKVLSAFAVIFGVYLALYWNSYGRIATPAQLIRQSIEKDRELLSERNYYSTLYREFENYNLAATIQRSPVVGIGFGNKYDMPIPLADIPFTLRDYIPHNEIFWVMVKMGAIGFFFFWFFFNAYLVQGTSVFLRLTDPYLKAVCAVCVIAVINQIVVSYYDLQLTYYRNMVYLGVLMGLIPVLEAIEKREPERFERTGPGGAPEAAWGR